MKLHCITVIYLPDCHCMSVPQTMACDRTQNYQWW